MFKDIEEIITAHRVTGGAFFNRNAMLAFRSKVYDDIYGGELFITSEKRGDHPRRYTVRKLSSDRRTVVNVSDFEQFDTIRKARAFARGQVQ